MVDPRVPGRLKVAVAATAFSVLAVAAAGSFAMMLPDAIHTRLAGLIIGFAFAHISPRAFPFWRTRFTVKERKTVLGGALGGGLLGFFVSGLASLIMLSPNLPGPMHSPPLMAFVAVSVLACSVAGAYWVTSEAPLSPGHSFRNESIS